MVKKKGFTLIEILCVIVLLAVITIIVSSNVLKITDNGNKEVYCLKLKMLEDLASDYAKKYERELNNSNEEYNGYKSITITVNDLIKAGLVETNKDGKLENPLDNSSLNATKIIIYLKNNQIKAHIDSNNIC